MYESFDDLTTVRKQHFVEWFCGNHLNTDIWNEHDVDGTGTFAMKDSEDGGFSVKAGTSSGDESELDFNNIRPYSHTGSVCIFVTKAIASNSYWTNNVGFTNTQGLSTDYACMQNQDSDTYFSLISKDGSTFNRGSSDIAVDNNWHGFKLECTSTHLKLTIDGVLEVNKTDNRPTAKLQPVVNIYTQSGSAPTAGEGLIRYFEAYNT